MSFRKAISLAAYLAITLPLAGCAFGQKKRIVVMNCISDPLSNSLQCTDADGKDREIPYKDSANMVCRTPGDDQILNEAARSCR